MKVVFFCGGLGTRLREHSDTIPKPLVPVGHRPILWHLMRYYAHFGHTDFVLCLGYRGDMIRDYFLQYNEALTNDFTLHGSDHRVELHSRDLEGWRITFVDTGLHANIGQRLLRVRRYVEDEPAFLANYADGLSDLPLDVMVGDFQSRAVVASFASVRSSLSYHSVHAHDDGTVMRIGPMANEALWINGGYFALRHDIFDYLHEGEELVVEPFARLIAAQQLATFRWAGYWQSMDTFKDKIALDRMEARGECPWMLWQDHPARPRAERREE
jgi:glucose-1-phosphate cytidylyltransferase